MERAPPGAACAYSSPVLRPLLIALLLFAVTRALFVAAMGDVFVYGEELDKGFVARCLLGEVDVPYARLPYHPYEGGGFVASHGKAAAFAVMGSSMLAQKVCGLLWGLAVVAATVALLHRHGGGGRASASAAALGGAFLVLGPDFMQRSSLLHLGIHYEAILFIALVLDLGLRAAEVPRGERVSARLLAGLGLAAGFGTYFSYQVPLAVLTVAGLFLVRAPARLVAPPLVLGTLLGLTPLGLMYLATGREIFDLHGQQLGAAQADLLTSLHRGLFGGFGLAAVLIGAASAIAGSFAAPPSGARMRAVLALGGFALLWCVAAAATGLWSLPEGPLHWFLLLRTAPLVWSLLVLAGLLAGPALALTDLERMTPPAKIARSTAAILVGIGLIHTARIVDEGTLSRAPENLRFLASLRGDDPRGAMVKLGARLEAGRDTADGAVEAEVVGRFLSVEDPPSPGLLTDLVAGVTQATSAPPGALLSELRAVAGDAPETERAIREGLGASVFHHAYPGRLREALDDPDLEPATARGLGRYGLGWYGATDLTGEVQVARGALHGQAFLEGVGARVFRTAVMQPYWGPERLLRPGVVRRLMEERAAALGPEELAGLLAGFDREAHAFGVVDPLWPTVDSDR